MKNTRKLIPAIAMLLISAVMMSTASFAWFSTNTTATANGMHIKVASATNIMISDAADGTFVSTQAYDKSIASLVPASAVPAADPAFFYMKEAGDKMVADNAAYQDDSVFDVATADAQYLTFTSYLKVVGEGVDGSIVPEISITTKDAEGDGSHLATKDDSPVYPALRVLIVCEGNAFLYAPVTGANNEYKPIASVEGGKPTEGTALTAQGFATNNDTAIVATATAEQVYEVSVYIWLEGQDPCCKAANAISLDKLDIAILFNYAE